MAFYHPLVFCVCAAGLGGLNAFDYPSSVFGFFLNKIRCDFKNCSYTDFSNLSMLMCGSNKSMSLNEFAATVLNNTDCKLNETVIKFIIGGLNSTDKGLQEIACSYFEGAYNRCTYVVIFGHGSYTSVRFKDDVLSYRNAFQCCKPIGMKFTELLVLLYNSGVSLKNIIILGHSLASYIMAEAADGFKNKTGMKLHNLYCADPAGPCANESLPLQSGLALFILIIHCNKGVYGDPQNLGDMNCYANDGKRQPSCNYTPIVDLFFQPEADLCSHQICFIYLFETVLHPEKYNGTECNSYNNFINNRCAKNKTALIGVNSDPNDKGIYYFKTDV